MTSVVTHTFVADTLTPVRAYARIRARVPSSASFLLESVVGAERWGRYSILGYAPSYEAILRRTGPGTCAWSFRGERIPKDLRSERDPLRAIENLFKRNEKAEGDTPAIRFARAHIGFFAWDLIHTIEKVPDFEDEEPRVLARLLGSCTVVVFDNFSQTVTVAAHTNAELEETLEHLHTRSHLANIALPDRSKLPSDIRIDQDDDAHIEKVKRAKEYIAAGDAFQIVLARKFQVPQLGRDPFDVYRAMRVINPSPYMYYLDLPPAEGESGRTQIAGASPETSVRLEDGVMMVRPIAGTRWRGKTLEEDEALERELLTDEKELAEHVMLIDLGRNDVGRVAEIGSVKLAKRMQVERYSHVMHIVSEVQGRVRSDLSPLEVFRAAFPAGTLSGAPKVRAMQVIRELEGRPRGVYGGAIGYANDIGDLDFAIAIRTAVCRNGFFEVTAGGGIVEASDPQAEAEETRNKARAVLCAIEAASQTSRHQSSRP